MTLEDVRKFHAAFIATTGAKRRCLAIWQHCDHDKGQSDLEAAPQPFISVNKRYAKVSPGAREAYMTNYIPEALWPLLEFKKTLHPVKHTLPISVVPSRAPGQHRHRSTHSSSARLVKAYERYVGT